MLADMARQQARVDIVSAAATVTDQELDGLAFVEISDAFSMAEGWQRKRRGGDRNATKA
jgi:hypothetical protein